MSHWPQLAGRAIGLGSWCAIGPNCQWPRTFEPGAPSAPASLGEPLAPVPGAIGPNCAGRAVGPGVALAPALPGEPLPRCCRRAVGRAQLTLNLVT